MSTGRNPAEPVVRAARRLLDALTDGKAHGPVLERRSDLRVALEEYERAAAES